MASLTSLPPELLLIMCEHLAGDQRSLKSLALTCRHVRDCALKIHKEHALIDLSTGNTQIIHKVMAHLLSQASSNTPSPSDIYSQTTGDFFADRVLRLASKFTTIKLRVADSHGIATPVNQHLLGQYMALVSKLEPPTMYGAGSWRAKFLRGSMHDLLRFLLRVTRHLTTLEMEGSLHWMGQTNVKGMCSALRTLRLAEINDLSLSRSSSVFLCLPTLEVLEFARMRVASTTLKWFSGKMSVTCLRFLDCWASTSALSKCIKACRALENFEYTLSPIHWASQPHESKQYDLAQLLYDLREHHGATLKYLRILTEQVQVRDRCHFPDELAQLTVLRRLVISHDLLHPRHFESPLLCEHHRLRQHELFTGDHVLGKKDAKSPADVILSLALSLQKLELHDCEGTLVTSTLLRVMQFMLSAGHLPNLYTIKAECKHNSVALNDLEQQELVAFTARVGGRSRPEALRVAAATIPRLHLDLHMPSPGVV